MLNTTIYAGVSASGASLFAAMAGYLAKFRYRAREAIFLTILGSLMGGDYGPGPAALPEVAFTFLQRYWNNSLTWNTTAG